MSDNITLPRKHIDYAAHALEHFNKDAPDPLVSETIHHLRAALAAEQPKPKPEPVAWLSRDEARLALWKSINSREFGNPTDDKLILDHLRQQGLWIGKVTSPVPPEDEALRRDAERYRKQKERSYRLQRLLKECVKVMQANAVFRGTKAHKDLKTRIRAELENKT